MGFFSSRKDDNSKKVEKPKSSVPWQNLTEMHQLDEILNDKTGQKNILFKHSTRCGVSTMTKRQFEQEWPAETENISVWYLDLLNYRNISNAIAEKTGVYHQSPQAIALVNGEVRYDASHSQVSARSIIKSLEQ